MRQAEGSARFSALPRQPNSIRSPSPVQRSELLKSQHRKQLGEEMKDTSGQSAAQLTSAAESPARPANTAATSALDSFVSAADTAIATADLESTVSAVARAGDTGAAEPTGDGAARTVLAGSSNSDAPPPGADCIVGSLFSCPITKVSRFCLTTSISHYPAADVRCELENNILLCRA